jgi:hypothetical protein
MNDGRPDTFPVEITSVVKSVSIQAEILFIHSKSGNGGMSELC